MDVKKLLMNGEYEKVIELLEGKAKTPEEYNILGLAYYGLGKRNKAVSNFRKALSLDPKNKDALFNLAEIFLQLEKYPKAKDYALKLLQLSSNDWAVHDILSDVYMFEGFFDKALEHLQKALTYAPPESKEALQIKLDKFRGRRERVKNQKKLAIICAKGLDTFIDDIVKGLSDEYWVQRWAVTNDREIKQAIDWADIVWLEWANEVAIIGTNYQNIPKKRVVVRLHSYEAFTELPTRINWRFVDKVLFVAPHMVDIFFERFPYLKGKINYEVIFNGIDLEKLPFKDRKHGFEIAWVGHINYKKAPELAIQVIKKLVDTDRRYRLHFAGDFQDPRYEIYLKHMVDKLNLGENVVFHGWVDDMDEFWEDKNFLLHTSLHEGHPYAVMEAMARGIKPVIHWFRGAEKLYPKNLLFGSIDEAVEAIIGEVYESENYRDFVSRYSLENQIELIKSILKGLEESKQGRRLIVREKSILIVDSHFRSTKKGHAYFMYRDLKEAFEKFGFKVALSAPVKEEIEVEIVEAPDFFGGSRNLDMTKINEYLNDVYQTIKSRDIRIVFIQSGDMPFFIVDLFSKLANHLHNVNFYIVYHSPKTFELNRNFFEKLEIPENVIAVGATEHIAEVAKKYFKRSVFYCHPYPKTFNESLMGKSRGNTSPRKVFTYLGIARIEKGFHLLPRLIAHINQQSKDFKYYIQTPPPTAGYHSKPVLQSIELLRKLPNVFLIKELSRLAYSNLLVNSDFSFIIYDEDSYFQRLSFTYMESLSSGTIPIVNPKLWFVDEAIREGVAVPYSDPSETSKIILKLYKSNKVKKLKSRAIELASEMLSRNNVQLLVEEMIRHYQGN